MDTIIVLNSSRQVIDILSNNGSDPSAPFFDDIFKSELDTGAETYEFTTLANPRTGVTLEVGNYVLFKYNGKYKLFQIMETTDEHTEGKKLLTCYCEMAGMELLNDYCEPFTVEGNFITFLNTILQDTNWQVGLYSASLLDNIQTVTTTDYENVYKLIQDNLATFGGVEIEFRAEFYGNQLASLLIDCYEAGTRGNRTYRRFEYGEDIKGITRERNINDLATAVIGIGKNGLEFKDVEWKKTYGNPCDKPLQQNFVVDVEANDLWNNGGKYIKTTYKSDTEDPYTLIQETWDYLQEIKQPKFDYDVDLALVAEDYRDISIGDTNYVVDFDYNPPILLEARVGTLELSFSNPNDNKCILTNYKELTSILSQPVDLNTVGNMIQSHFPIQGTDIAMGAIGEGHINVTYYQAIKADIVQAGLAEVGTLIADKADITDLNALNADIENLRATKAEIDDLTATNGNITNLTSQVGNIETLLAGNATAGNVQSIHLTSANAVIDDAIIKNAMIDSVSANKVNTGTINTNDVNIESTDGGIKISGATQQFKDKEGHVRVQIGKDASGNFTFCLFSQDGVGILLDETGIKAGAVPDGLIVNDMVAENASIAGSKLDIASVVETINGSTTTLNSSVIKFDDTGQSLLVAFNQLKNQVDTIQEVTIGGDLSSIIEKVNTHTTQIGVIQGQITSLIQNTTITKADGQVVQLKDAYNQTVSKVDSNTTKIGTLETNYNKVTGDIESVTDRTTTLETNLSGVTARVTQNETDISSTKSTVSQHTTDISGIKSSITSLESTTEDHTTRLTTVENDITKEAIVNKISDTFATTDTVSGIESRVQTAENKLTKNGITSIVGDYYATKSEATNAQNRADKAYSKATTAQQTAEGFNQSITAELSNNYYKKTDIDNTINGINLKFTEQVSNTNLLPHSNPVPADYAGWEIMYDATDAYIYDSDATYIGIASKTDVERFLSSPTVYVKPGEYYSLNGKVLAQTNTKGGDVFILAKKFGSTKEWDYAYHCYTIPNDGAWHRFNYSVQLPSDVESFFIRVDNNGLRNTSSGMDIVVFFGEFMLVKGKDFYPEWVPSPTELYTGNISLDRNGVTVSMTVGDNNKGSTNINAEGLTIYNNYGTRQAWFGQGNTAFIDKLATNKLVEPSVVRCDLSRPLNLYCAPTATGDGSGRNENNKASSISNALAWLKKEYGNCSYRSDINIILSSGDYWGADNYVGGWLGSGEINIYLKEWACLRSTLRIEDNTMAVNVKGYVNAENWATQNNAFMYLEGEHSAIEVRNSTVTVAGINMRKLYWGGDTNTWNNYQTSAITTYTGARVYVTCCDIVGFWNTCYVSRNSIVALQYNRGHCVTSGHADLGGIIIRGNICPLRRDATITTNGGQSFGGASAYENSWFDPKPEAPYTPPAAPTENWQTTDCTFWATNLWTSPEGSGSGTNARNGCWGQGKWGSYKPHRGYATFEGVGPWCSGGRNFTVYLTMTRLNTNHGYAGATPVPKIKQGDGNFWSSGTAFARGDTKTITLPSAVADQLISGGTGTLEMWAGTSTNDYSFYDNVSIRIVCEKNFV